LDIIFCRGRVGKWLASPATKIAPREATRRLELTLANQQDNRTFSWIIDRQDIIVQVNDAWLAFAQENSAPQLTREAVVNQSLWSFITGLETTHLYKLIFGKVRTKKIPLAYPFRCGSPDCRRFLEMEVSPLPGEGISFRSEVKKLEFREPVKLLEPGVKGRSDRYLRICSWCKKIYAKDQWLEIEEALIALDLFGEVEPPLFTHGICEFCHDLVLKGLTPA
jgi:hypothetical protein